MDRIKGVKLSIYTEDFGDLLRQYQDPEGWAISDSGVNEDETGYYVGIQARGVGGVRQISLSLTAAALRDMLNAVEERFEPKANYDSFAIDTNVYNTTYNTTAASACTCDGCLCQPV